MACHQADAAEQAAWRSSGQRPMCPQRHLLGPAIRGTLARSAASFGPCTTCYHRFVRWRRAGVWGRIIDALAAAHDAAVQMIDTSIVRVHQHGACITRNQRQSMGRSRGGLTSKIHAVVDSNGLPVRLALSLGEAHVAAIRSDSAPISPALATGSSGSSTGSDNAAESRRVTTGSLPTTLPSSSSPQSDCGCVFIILSRGNP